MYLFVKTRKPCSVCMAWLPVFSSVRIGIAIKILRSQNPGLRLEGEVIELNGKFRVTRMYHTRIAIYPLAGC